ncbi:hypothetical protein H5410_058616 [Solanum commersonii]|uniref:Uncharacterized protein n=1 Tax=Solanum commersonii TaxID=4109 RepID=A0A9J5WS28_SOLCO|nr:hypothetical protein H5410_058616 [Solanum commersonii]
MKWLWRFHGEESTLWREVIQHKYGQSSPWYSNEDPFPDLLVLCNRTDATINEHWYPQGWNLSFKRHLNDWEVEWVASFLKDIEVFPNTDTF